MTYFLAIDQSTQSTKVMLFDNKAKLLDSVSKAHEQFFPKSGWVEHDANQIYANLLAAMNELQIRNRATFESAACLSITNQRETIVVFDKDSGEPLSNAIVWLDRRGEEFCAVLRGGADEKIVEAKTGLRIDTYFPASKLTWLTRNNPNIHAALRNGRALIGTIDTYLIYRLTGGKVYATDHTNASRTLFYDIDRMNWDKELVRIFDLDLAKLPEIFESASIFGETNLNGILPRAIPIAGVIGDSQAALFAERCYEPGMAKVTFGTGSSIMMNIGEKRIQSGDGIVNALAWVLNNQPTYAFEGITNFTGATISWMQNQLELIENPAQSETLAKSIPDNGGVILVPSFVGLGAPYWRADVKGAIFGLTPGVTRAHVVRAGLEGIAFTVTDVLRVMENKAGVALKRLFADGGPVRNSFLMQFVADINQRELHASTLPELSALGAVFSGGLAIGVYAGLDEIRAIDTGVTTYEPGLRTDKVEELFAKWNAAIRKVLA